MIRVMQRGVMRADKAQKNKRRVINNFDPSTTTDSKMAEWQKLGDIIEAKQQAQLLAFFLLQMAQNKEAQQAIMRLDIGWIGADVAKFIAKKLLANPCTEKGKQHKSGAELFAKVLVPTKTTQSQFQARHIAALVYQLGSDSEENLELATELFNNRIVANNEILRQLKDGNRNNLKRYNPTLPTSDITKRKAQTSYRKYVQEIKAAEAD